MIRTAADFTALAAAPGVNSPLLGVRFAVRDRAVPSLRIGIAASKKVGGAVVRNRIRRRLKAITRDLAPDLLIGVRVSAATASSEQLRAALTDCLRRAKLLSGANQGARA
jgi:ribonuclease P protein component